MRCLAGPMIGGLAVSFLMELILFPVIVYLAKRWEHPRDWNTHVTGRALRQRFPEAETATL